MYHKHNTEGVIIGGSEKGESSKNLHIFTREFGLIYASVQNVRSINSKLRYGVQDFTCGYLTLVHGKNSWKLVGAESGKNFWTLLDNKEKQITAAHIFSLLRKLTGEEKNEELFTIVINFLNSLVLSELSEIKMLEILTVLKILQNLGYLNATGEEIEALSANKKSAIELINKSLKEAQLTL